MAAKRFPVGLQDFAGIRSNGFFYIDKTEYIHRLVHNEG